ncbi:MAG: hypothetical protein KBD26_01410 [Candidatus Pacebacteria bacterium]|nr:hypothetical protein [Candidatus Paceibacterota bacterium]MBP9772467.1 hypothetical protein [Candidatus Paceibacterota bacterium]
MEFISTFITLAGFIIGLGAVTVIDLHGFLGRKSPYWTEATIRTHKVTKPLIWIGILLVAIGTFISGVNELISSLDFAFRLGIIFLMILNGSFLSFVISPELLKREKEGRASEILPSTMQNKIVISFFVSFVLWWGLLAYIVNSIIL